MKVKPLSGLVAGAILTLSSIGALQPDVYASTAVYYSYKSAHTNQAFGKYTSLGAAQSAVSNIPGGVVKNSSWQIVYIQPSFYTYANTYSNKVLHVYPSALSAETSLMNIPGGAVKDSSWQFIFIEPQVAYYTYSSPNSNTITGVYTTLDDAESAVSNQPGAVVKNSLWQFLYQQPTYYTYDSVYSSSIKSVYPSLQAAETAVANIPGAAVKDSHWQFVYVSPVYYTYSSAYTNSVSGKYLTLQDAINAVKNQPGGAVKNSSWQYVYINQGYNTVDLRYSAPGSVTASSINAWINSASQGTSPLYGLGSSYIYAQNEYGADATYLLSHSIEESGWGKSTIATSKNNLFGYGAYTNSPNDAGVFPSDDYAIRFQAWEVRQNYLTPGASNYWNSPTLYGMNHNYATDSSWSSNISSLMNEYVQGSGGNFSDYQQYAPQDSPAAPSSSAEPVYYLNGAQGKALSAPAYGNLPVFGDMGPGENYMLANVLSVAMESTYDSQVAKLQQFLKTTAVGGTSTLSVDGSYGPNTAAAVQKYQQSQGLGAPMVSGYAACDLTTWERAFGSGSYQTIPTGATLSIVQIKQGMFDGVVTEWYQVTGNGVTGWVNSNDVQFTNVYRIYPASGYTVTINPGEILHAGDYVVSNDGTTILFTDNTTLLSGPKGTARLTQISH